MHTKFSNFFGFSAAFLGLALLTLAGLAVGCRPNADTASGVEVVPSTEPLNAATTFEVRFDQPMVSAAAVGGTNAPPPVEVRPRLAGEFLWTSQRGGTFTPAEPLALGTAYTFTLRAGLTDDAGQPTAARLRHTLVTPDFGLSDVAGEPRGGECPGSPKLRLLFNAPVSAATAASFLEFRSAAGQSVPATASQGSLAERRWGFSGDAKDRLSWEEWFQAARHTHTVALSPDGTNPAPNLLLVSPRSPLPPDDDWSLVVARGLPMAGARATLAEERRIRLGEVLPFALVEVSAHNWIHHGRSVRLQFSKPLPGTLKTNFADWITLSPAITNLTADLWGARLALHGDFALQTPYEITVRAGLLSAEGLTLATTKTNFFTVEPVPSRLYFPAVETGQFASGRRQFPLLVMNADQVRVRAKLLDDASAIHGLRGFGRAYSPNYYPRDKDFFEVNYELIAGRTIYDETFPGTVEVDEAVTIPLDWSRILGPGTNGAVFLCAERVAGNAPFMVLPSKNPPLPVTDTNLPPSPYPTSRHGFTVNTPVGLGVQAMVQVSDLGLVWKTAGEELLAFVFSLASGQPVPDAQVQLLTDENQLLTAARTDAGGLARLRSTTNTAWLAARTTNDFFAVEIEKFRIPLWSFNLPRSYDEDADSRIVRLFTDRDLYRPGDAIHLKGVVRDWVGDTLTVPPPTNGTLTLRDYRDSMALTTNVALSPFGTFDLSVALPADARQGFYSFQVRLGEASAEHGLQVLDFRPRAFEIKLSSRPAYAAGEPVAIPISAQYLFGKPLDHAQVRWTLQANDQPPEARDFEGFNFIRCWREQAWGRGPAGGTSTGEALLGGTNAPVLDCDPGTNALAPQTRHATLAVQVTDQNQQTLSQYAEFVRHSSDFYLGLKLKATVVGAGEPYCVQAVAIAPSGAGWTNSVKATLRLQRVDWQTARMLGAGNVATYRAEAVLTNVFTREVSVPPARALPSREWEAGPLPEFTVAAPGEYLLELSATDAAGRPVVCSEEFLVTAPREKLAWDYRNEIEVELVPDQPSYAPGETATLLLKTPLSGTALVTVERATVRRAFVTRLEGNAPAIRVPILPGDAPNVAVMVTLLRGATDSTATVKEPEYRVGARNLTIEDPAQRLRITLTPSATNFLPAATVAVEALVRDARGVPVADAEVTLYAVDEGVLAMSDYQVPDLLADFFAPRPIRVDSGISLPSLLPEDPTQLRFSNKGYVAGGGGQERVRKNFAACAFWHATLHTDAGGRLQVQFTAPDAITRYRLLAVALTQQNQFGGGESAFSISKPLLIEPALPPIARRTDRLTARAVVLNQTDTAGEVEVTLALDATAKVLPRVSPAEPTSTQRLTVPPRGSAVVEFPLELIATGSARWIWRARFTAPTAPPFTDAVQSSLEILPPAPLLTERFSLTATGSTNLLARANPQMLRGQGGVTVTLANSRLVALADAVPQLLHYPYGCAEQSASTLLPWLVLRATPTLAPLVARGTNDAEVAIRRGVRRLLDMRTQGGLSYWPGGREPMPWATAYATFVLSLAQQNGVELPEGVLKQLGTDLADGLPATLTNRHEIPTGCLALYALATAGDARPAWHEKFFEQRALLSGEARALLALAISLADGPDEMIEKLLSEKPAAAAAPLAFGSPRREQAIRLLAWLAYQADAPEVGQLVEILVARLAESVAGSTQDGAWTLLALSTYANECEGELPELAGSLAWNGAQMPFRVDETNRLVRLHFSRTNDETAPLLQLDLPAGSRLFTRVELATVPPETQQTAQDHGLSVARTYTALGETNQPLDLKNLRVGDRVLVTLRIAVPQPAEFLVVDDPLPAVLEAVLPEFRAGPGLTLPGGAETDWFSDFRELRADRALFFANDAPAGAYMVRYLTRVRAAGTATAPACKIEAMYAPEKFGLSASQVLTANPAK